MSAVKAPTTLTIERAAGCLAGVAIGDAMGMPCEFLTREQVAHTYGRIKGFVAPGPAHIHSRLRAGQVTDDTELTVEFARALIGHGALTPEAAAEAVMKWAREHDVFNSSVLGPSSRRALERLMAGGDPSVTGSHGDTVGAAMRVAPVGLANAGMPKRAAEECYLSCLPTHGASVAIGGACAVACAVAVAATVGAHGGGSAAAAACAAGATSNGLKQVLDAALWGAAYGEERGIKWAGPSVTARIRLALRIVAEAPGPAAAEEELYAVVGVGMAPTELVATALGIIKLYEGDCRLAVEAAASMGGDSDTLASMVGAITGAYQGISAFPSEWVDTVEQVNGLDIRGLAEQLLRVREGRTAYDRD